MKRISYIIVAIACAFIATFSHATDLPDFEMQYDKSTGEVTGIVNKTVSRSGASQTSAQMATLTAKSTLSAHAKETRAIRSADNFLSSNGSLFGIKNVSVELHPRGFSEDDLGMQQVRYAKLYNGIEEYGKEILAILNRNGEVVSVKGKVHKNLNVNTNPRINRKRALRIAKTNLERERQWKKVLRVVRKGERKICRNKRSIRGDRARIARCVNRSVKRFDKANGFYANEPVKLYIVNEKSPRLAYRVSLTNTLDNGMTYFVDARSGEIFKRNSHMHHATVRHVFDCGDHFGDLTCYMDKFTTFWGVEFYYGRSEGHPPSGPSPAWPPIHGSTDVDYFYEEGIPDINSFYLEKFGRNGMNSLGGTVIPSASGQNNITRFFANGDWSTLATHCAENPEWAAAGSNSVIACRGSRTHDLIAHEFTHIVSNNLKVNPDFSRVSLQYEREPGALHEHISDLMGESYERWITGSNDWKFWGNVERHRILNDPSSKLDPFTGTHYPDSYNSSNFSCTAIDEACDVANGFCYIHHNSTVPSYAAYLASEGGDFNGCSIQGIGLEKVEQIWYRALTTYFIAEENFNMVYHSLNQSCDDFANAPAAFSDFVPPFVITADDCVQVKKALQAVELNQAGYCSGIPAEIPECAQGPQYNADFNGDGVVDLWDWNVLRVQWGQVTPQGGNGTPLLADANGDGVVDTEDYNIWYDEYMAGAGASGNGSALPAPPPPTLPGDCNGLKPNTEGAWEVQVGNGMVDGSDFLDWQRSYGLTGPAIACDFNADGSVDAADYTLWRNNFGAGMSFCDINKDGEIDLEDFNIIRSQFGQTGSNLAADLNNDGIVDLLDYNHWKNNCINHYSEETVFPPLTILGDCNFDGVVDAADYVVWRNQFGSEPERAGLGCDLNGDGSVDAADYTVWRDRYGSSQ